MNDKLAISRVVSRVLLALVVLAVATLAIGHYLVLVRLTASELKIEAEMLGEVISRQIIAPNPGLWQTQPVLLERLLALRTVTGTRERRRVIANGRVVTEQGEPGPAPHLVCRAPLLLAGRPVAELEVIRSLRPLLYQSLLATALFTAAGTLLYAFLKAVPLQRLRAVESAMRQQALTDKLTGLYNRHGFHLCLQQEMARAERCVLPLALVSLDVDHFKCINDAHGHAVGDEVLRELARRLRTRIRAVDKLARWGGEELQILAPETSLKGAAMLAEKIRTELEAHDFPPAGRVTVSAGVTVLCAGESADAFIARADLALYRAKAAGRNRVVVLTASGSDAHGANAVAGPTHQSASGTTGR